VYALYIVFCAFVIFLLAIVLSFLLLFTDFDYPFVSSNSSITENIVFLIFSINGTVIFHEKLITKNIYTSFLQRLIGFK
jgi:hypothetical protein